MANRVTYVVDKEGKIAFVEVGNTAIDPKGAVVRSLLPAGYRTAPVFTRLGCEYNDV
jgi:hypothetical protein